MRDAVRKRHPASYSQSDDPAFKAAKAALLESGVIAHVAGSTYSISAEAKEAIESWKQQPVSSSSTSHGDRSTDSPTLIAGDGCQRRRTSRRKVPRAREEPQVQARSRGVDFETADREHERFEPPPSSAPDPSPNSRVAHSEERQGGLRRGQRRIDKRRRGQRRRRSCHRAKEAHQDGRRRSADETAETRQRCTQR